MRRNVNPIIKIGKQRIASQFLFFPKTLFNEDGIEQWRWLEFASWKQEWRARAMFEGDGDTSVGWWHDMEWLD